MSNKLDKFKILCQKIQRSWETTYGINEIEEYLLEALIFIKQNLQDRAELSNYFIERIQRKEKFPLEIIIFCMRELQWEEIKEAAIKEIHKTDDFRIISMMNQILDVYEAEWEDGDMYTYYSKK